MVSMKNYISMEDYYHERYSTFRGGIRNFTEKEKIRDNPKKF